jgi:HEAT repeat protein
MEIHSMTDHKDTSLPFESSEASEQQLWQALGDLPRAEPSADLRRRFYEQLEKADSPGLGARIRGWLGLSNNTGWVTATACLLVGFAVAQLSVESETVEPDRLAALEENIALLNRELVLDRLQDDAPGTRLLGIHNASYLVQDDREVAQALLVRATEDRSSSVRSAAIDALGPQLNSAPVGNELMKLLENAESPIVQLALVDLVLRNGNQQQLARLLELTIDERLHPDLIRHVNKSLGRESI